MKTIYDFINETSNNCHVGTIDSNIVKKMAIILYDANNESTSVFQYNDVEELVDALQYDSDAFFEIQKLNVGELYNNADTDTMILRIK